MNSITSPASCVLSRLAVREAPSSVLSVSRSLPRTYLGVASALAAGASAPPASIWLTVSRAELTESNMAVSDSGRVYFLEFGPARVVQLAGGLQFIFRLEHLQRFGGHFIA